MRPTYARRGLLSIAIASLLTCSAAFAGTREVIYSPQGQNTSLSSNLTSFQYSEQSVPAPDADESLPNAYIPVQTFDRATAYHDPAKEAWKPKGVFAHFMVSNVLSWTTADWVKDMRLAKDAHIDAFALNMAYNEGSTAQIANALAAAEQVAGFYVFFSFDYAGNGPWPKQVVSDLLKKYQTRSGYYRYQGKMFVSTFEGPESSQDWIEIKAATGCFFMPDWSSLGAEAALKRSDGVADGLFSWAAWPWGNTNMDTYVDASYLFFLNDKKPYMMPVSPWFYTNMPGFGKNWAWRGDDLWRDRWEQVLVVKPEFVQIITWNDYGESHYIGPIHKESMVAFGPKHGRAPNNYALDFPHDGWRSLLPFYIDTYKYGKATVSDQRLVAWYRSSPSGCGDKTTTGNTASQLQLEMSPDTVMQQKIFFSALLVSSHSTVTITVGGKPIPANFHHKPAGEVGVYHGSVKIDGHSGPVQITVTNGVESITLNGRPITNDCSSGPNWNAWVGSQTGKGISPRPYSIKDLVCVEGTAPEEFKLLCTFTCSYGYCPITACLCTKLGSKPELPRPQKGPFYPADKKSSLYIGLCDFACTHGICPPKDCSRKQGKRIEPTESPFNPESCTAGTSDNADLAEVCDFTCKYGYCPRNSCTCTKTGPIQLFKGAINHRVVGTLRNGGKDNGICNWACKRGVCPLSCARGLKDSSGSIDWNPDDSHSGNCALKKYRDIADFDKTEFRDLSQTCQARQVLETLIAMINVALGNHHRATTREFLRGKDDAFNNAFNNFVEGSVMEINAVMQGTWFKKEGLSKYFICRLEADYGKLKKGTDVPCPGQLTMVGAPNLNVVLRNEKEKQFWDDLKAEYGITSKLLFPGGGTFAYGQRDKPDNDAEFGISGVNIGLRDLSHVAVEKEKAYLSNYPNANPNFIKNPLPTFSFEYRKHLKTIRESMKKEVSALAKSKSTLDDALDLILASQSTIYYAFDMSESMVQIRREGDKFGAEKQKNEAKQAGLVILEVVVPIVGSLLFGVGGSVLSAVAGSLLMTAPIDYAVGIVIKENGSDDSVGQLIEAIAGTITLGGLGGISKGAVSISKMADSFVDVPVSVLARMGPKNMERIKRIDFAANVCRRAK